MQSLVSRFGVVLTILFVGFLMALAPPKVIEPNITEQQHREGTLEVGVLIRKQYPTIIAATMVYPASVFGLNPAQNKYKADVLLVGTVKLAVAPGEVVLRPWCAYCRDGIVIAAEDLSLGNLTE